MPIDAVGSIFDVLYRRSIFCDCHSSVSLVVAQVVVENQRCHAYGLSADDLEIEHRSSTNARGQIPGWKSIKAVRQPSLSEPAMKEDAKERGGYEGG